MKTRHLKKVVLAAAFVGATALAAGLAARAAADESTEEHLEKKWDADAGGTIYNETCVACHGEDGKGTVPGAPDFTKKGGALSKGDAVLMTHVEQGFQSPGSPMAMPPKGGMEDLTMDDIMNVLAYIHREFEESGEDE